MNRLSKSVWGIIFIILGVVLGLNAVEIININIFFDGWWTLFIIIPTITELLDKRERNFSNIVWLIIGVSLLLVCQGILRFDMLVKLIIPFILVTVGISFLFKERFSEKFEKIKKTNSDDLESIVAIFSDQKINKDNDKFSSATIDALFGGVTLDLRGAILEDETIIKASAIFGGIDILLPKDVNVKIKSVPIFGGITNKVSNRKDNEKTIYIDCFCMFGGVDINDKCAKNN